jgi:hypothetical protein
VANGQLAWFAQDHVARDAEGRSRLLRDSEALVAIVFVGTNDVGIRSFVTNDQAPNVSLPNVADCQLDTLRALQALGVKHFIVNALVPLQLTRLYANDSTGTIYYPATHDGKAWHDGITNLVHSLNRILHDGVGALNRQWEGAAAVSWFNTYDFFWEMYDHPMRYFNGSLPANVTGHCHQCPDPDDYRQCGMCGADRLARMKALTSSLTVATVRWTSATRLCGGTNCIHRSSTHASHEVDVNRAYLAIIGPAGTSPQRCIARSRGSRHTNGEARICVAETCQGSVYAVTDAIAET